MTLLEFFEELNSFTNCEKYFSKAAMSDTTTDNNSELRDLLNNWTEGIYDEDPEYLRDELVSFI
jgi:hypothetical protein